MGIELSALPERSRELLESVHSAVERCNHCGFCQAGCPTYKVTGIEWMSARGRLALIKAAIDGQIAFDEAELGEPLWSCLGCDGCTMHCPPAIKTDEIVDAAKEALALKSGASFVEWLTLRRVLPNPGLLSAGVKAMRLAQGVGLMPIGAKVGKLFLGGQLDQASDSLPELPAQTAREKLARIQMEGRQPALEKRRARVGYFLGCATNLLYPDVATATVSLLRKNGVEAILTDNVCCGKPAAGYGDREGAKALARKNLVAFREIDLDSLDAIVVDCPTCGSYLQKYAELLADEPKNARFAESIARKTIDIAAFLSEIGMKQPTASFKRRVTYHDPCHLAHFQSVTAQPRAFLKSVPDLDFKEAREADLCCGGAGAYSMRERDLSMGVLDRKMANFAATEAGVLATACPSCMLQLGYGARRAGLSLEVMHTVQILDQATEG